MKRVLIWTLISMILAPAAWAAGQGWPEDLAKVEQMVRSTVGEIPYDRVKVRRFDGEIEVSIKLKNLPRGFERLAREQATEDDVFLATSLVELFEPDFSTDIMSFNLTPAADILSYYYGFAVFNFGKKIKLPAEIKVRNIGDEEPEIRNFKKKYKIKKNRLALRFVESTVNGPGLYELCVIVGPWQILSYFCVGCE